MQRKLVALSALAGLVFASPVFADANANCVGNCPANDNSVTNQGGAGGNGYGFGLGIGQGGNAAAAAAASAQQRQSQGQQQGQSQGQIGINKNVNLQGNKQTMIYKEAEIPTDTTNRINYSGSYDVKTNPPVFAPSINPSSPCMGSTVVGGSGGLVGLTIGTSWKDDDCGFRETARMFNEIGNKSDAIAVLCASEYAKNAPACKGAAKAADAAPAPAPLAKVEQPRTDHREVAAANLVTSPDGRRWTQRGNEWIEVR